MKKTLPKPQAVIFDWDNTLVDTWPIIHAALKQTFETLGMQPWTLEETRARVGKSMRDSFPELFGENWQGAGKMYQQNYKAMHLEHLAALPQAQDVLARVQQQGLFCAAVSNKKGDTLRKEAAALNWEQYFGAVVGADDALHDKPHTAPVELAFKDSAVPLDESVWFVGDSEVDLECAANVGCTAILYGPHAKLHESFDQAYYKNQPYHFYAENHAELLSLFGEDAAAVSA